MATETKSFAPTVLMPDGTTVTPTNIDWLMGFALAGCEWAIEALPKAIEQAELRRCETFNGGSI